MAQGALLRPRGVMAILGGASEGPWERARTSKEGLGGALGAHRAKHK